METVQGENDLLLVWRPLGGGAELLWAASADSRIVLPETVAGRPVTALSHHAFAPDRPMPEGNVLRIICGPDSADRDNRKLRRVTLPAALRQVGDYAFYNCVGMELLEWTEPVDHWGSSVFMNCRLLDTFLIHAADDRAESVSYLAGELSGRLDVTVTYPEGEAARLLFPEFFESYEENSPAHHFDYNISGPGYPYHHLFRQRALVLKEYDALWPAMLAMEHDPDCALRMAWHRLRQPRELTEEAAGCYRRYLEGRAGDVLALLLNRRDARGLSWFLEWCGPDGGTLTAACEQARTMGAAEELALLLEQQHRRFPSGMEKRFDL